MNFFTSEKITDHMTCIRSGSGELLYLIEGTNKAILMDTSVGVYGLRQFVDHLTDKDYDLVITHGHIDHAMGTPEFSDKKIYMSLKDMDVFHGMQNIAGRMEYAQMNMGENFDLTESDFIPPTEVDFIDIKDGHTFDLGDLHVEILEVPGHTQGSIALLIKEERTLVLGDAGNLFTFLFDEKYSSTVTDYKKMLINLQKRVEKQIDRIYLCHGIIEVPVVLIPELIEVCDDILTGNTYDEPFEFMGETGAYIAKRMIFDENGPHRKDNKLANIVYRKDKLY